MKTLSCEPQMRGFRLAVATALLLTSVATAQQADSWRGLTLDSSSMEDAAGALGAPEKSKRNQKLRTAVSPWLNGDLRFERLEYRKLDGVKKATLYFLEGKLKAIELELERKVNPNSLESAYGIGFVPKVGGLDLAFKSDNYERNQGKVFPESYPLTYNLVGVAGAAYVVARVEQGSFSHAGKALAGAGDDGISFPGRVNLVQLVSRSLEDTRGLDALR